MRLLLTGILFIISLNAFGQLPANRNYTTEEGLPTNEVFYIFQDRAGYMWFSTDNGLSRYDGHSFQNFSTNDGLAENVCLNIIQDHKDRLWITSLSGKLTIYENGKFTQHPNNNNFSKVAGNSPMRSFVVDTNDHVWFTGSISYSQGYLWHFNGDTIIAHNVDTMMKDYGVFGYFFYKKINRDFIYGAVSVDTDKPIEKNSSINTLPFNRTYRVEDLYIYHTPHLHNSIQRGIIVNYDQGNYLMSNGGEITIINNDKHLNTFKLSNHLISYLYVDKGKNIWVGKADGGIDIYEDDKFTKIKRHLLGNLTISCITEDHEGGIWVSTTENGVFYYPSIETPVYDLKNILEEEKITCYSIYSNNLFLATERGNLFKVDSTFKVSKVYQNATQKEVYQLIEINQLLTVIGYQDIVFIDINGQHQYQLPILERDNKPIMRYLHYSSPIDYLVGTNAGIYINGVTLVKQSRSKISGIVSYKPNTYLVGSNKGLYVYSSIDQTWSLFKHETANYPVKKIIEGVDETIYVCTDGYGVYKIDPSDNIKVINESNGILSNIIENITVTDSLILISTSQGLSIIGKYSYNRVLNIQKQHGLLSNALVGICSVWNKYILINERGLTVTNNTGNLTIKIPPKLIINSLFAGEIDLQTTKKITKANNNLNLEYTGVSFKSNSVSYSITLNGPYSDTVNTTVGEYQFSNLPAGDYSLSITATNDHKISSKPYLLSFTILPHYTETWWFISLMILTGILVISSIFLLIIRNLKRRNNLQKELIMTEQKALRAQMNPHFTFNALNSIQYFLTDNDRRSATTFLSKFSMLVRKVLYNSSENLITLEEEISTLKLYLELEQLRFGDKINIEVNVDNQLSLEEILVPSMIIQPFLENAIWHGIMPKEDGKGSLKLDFSLKDNSLVCTITDDGIGREKSAELRLQIRKGHKSTGLKNIQERIKVLNHIYNEKITLTITDLMSDNGKALGTKVHINFELTNEK